MNKKVCITVLAIGLSGCASTGGSGAGRLILDSSGDKPDWVSSAEVSFEKEGQVFFKSQITIRGDQRVSGCYDLSKLQARQTLVSEISTEIRAKVHTSEQDLSENAEVYLGKTVLSDSRGDVQGMRIRQNYYERYRIGDTERIDCYVLGSIPTSEYEKLRNRIVNKVVSLDPRMKEVLMQDQMDMVKREPANRTDGKEGL